MSEYNGHESYEHWNVSLWINNDEGLYLMAVEYTEAFPLDQATEAMLSNLPAETSDGVAFTVETVRAALDDFYEE